jgi:nickel/cobalt transporter (NicO) family protein
MRSVTKRLTVALALVLVQPVAGEAHRLDEYLQATRIAIEIASIEVDIDLTAGVDVAPRVWALVDTDKNGRVSEPEARKYATAVLAAMTLRLDDRPCRLELVASRFPIQADLTSGSGPIHLQARAAIPPTGTGRHRVFFRNVHEQQMSVYLINALVPLDRAITIASQRRDPRQTQLTIGYLVHARVRS